MNPSALIDALGGTARVAEALCVSMQAVSNWRHRDHIPPRHHAALLRLAIGAGIAWHPPGMADLVAKPPGLEAARA
jgi:hypothetical protein